MKNSQEIFEQISELYTQFETEHNGTSKEKQIMKLVKSKN